MKAPRPHLTSKVTTSAPPAIFLLRMEAVIAKGVKRLVRWGQPRCLAGQGQPDAGGLFFHFLGCEIEAHAGQAF
jgi:hypothetical protein